MRLVFNIGHRTDDGTRLVRMLLGGGGAVVLAATVSFAVTGDPEQALYNGVSTVGGMALDQRYGAQLRCAGKVSDVQVFALSEAMARDQILSDYPDCRVGAIKRRQTRTSTSLYR